MANSTLQVTYRTKKTGTGTQDLTKEMGQAKMGLADMKAGLDMAGQAFGAVKAAVQSVIDPTVEYAGQIRELQRTIGSTAEESSKLIQAADDVGISAGTLQSALEAAIKRGVKPTIAGIADLADEYLSIQDPIARTKFLMDNFGKSGADLAPLMLQGADGIRAAGEEAERLGLVMSQDGVDAAREYEIAMDDFNDSVLAVKLAIAQGLLPAVSDAITQGAQYVQVWKNVFTAVTDGRMSLVDYLKTSAEVVWTDKTLAEVNAELTEAQVAQTAATDAAAARYQGYADAVTASKLVHEEYSGQIQSQTQWLEDLASVYVNNTTPATYGYLEAADLAKEGLAGLTLEMIYNKAAAGLDGDAAIALGISMGVLDTRVLALNESLPLLKEKYDTNHDGAISAAEAAAGYTQAVNDLATAILALPAHTDITVNTNFTQTGLPPGAYTGAPAGPPQGPIPQADGGDWLVTRPTLFLAGEAGPERATFTPLSGGGNQSGGGDTYNITINAGGASAQAVADLINRDEIRRRTGARRS